MPENSIPIELQSTAASITIQLVVALTSLYALVTESRHWWRGETIVPWVARGPNDFGSPLDIVRNFIEGRISNTLPVNRWNDVRMGLIAFLVVFIPVFGLHLIISLYEPYEHEVLRRWIDAPFAKRMELALLAIVIAPLREELVFRNLLQGLLEVAENHFLSGKQRGGRWRRGIVPILMSAAIFGYSHDSGQWPLILLGLALGYLFYQTHRLLPCIVLHATFNAFTVVQLWLIS